MPLKVYVLRNTGGDLVFTDLNPAIFDALATACVASVSGTWGNEVWTEVPKGQLLLEVVDSERFVPKVPPTTTP